MKTRSNRSHFPQLIGLVLLMIALVAHPVSTTFASDAYQSGSAQKAVIASAVIVPARIAELGFLISGIAKEVSVKEGDPVTTGQTLLVLDTPELEYAVIEADAALRSVSSYAELQKYRRVEDRRNGKVFYDVVPAVYRQRADARVQQAQTILELAQINLNEGRLTAPFDGTIASVSVIPGEFVASDQAVVTLASLDSLQLETTDLSERDIAAVKIGATVNIFIASMNENFTGKVIGISPRADVTNGDSIFKVTIAFDQQPQNLLWGMTATITIEE